ncbi:protein of unknown function [Rhodovastum atsumiense]|nr:protein of unknown function [Rhodovastum atsumiense]
MPRSENGIQGPCGRRATARLRTTAGRGQSPRLPSRIRDAFPAVDLAVDQPRRGGLRLPFARIEWSEEADHARSRHG